MPTPFDSRLVTTINRWVNNNLADMITGNNPLFFRLREQGNIVKGGGHGGAFVEPLMTPNTTSPGVIGVSNPYAALTFADITNQGGSSWTVAEKLIPISVQQYEMNAQGSETAKVNLVESVMKIQMAQFNENLAADLFAAEQTTGAQGSRTSLASIRAILNAGTAATTDAGAIPSALTEQLGNRAVSGAASTNPNLTVGGINRAAAGNAYFCTPIINSADTLSIQTLSNVISLATRGADSPDLIVLPRGLYDKLMGLLSVGGGNGGQMFTNSKLADAGFQAIKFRNADVIFDDRCPTVTYLNNSAAAYANSVFALNTNYIKLRAVSMKPEIKEYPDPRPIHIWTGYWNGQITVSNLGRVHARHVNMS